jgi:hypothetical protein
MATVLGIVAGTSSFLLSLTIHAPVTDYVEYRVLTPEVKRGEMLVVAATYHKEWECGGNALVSIVNQNSGIDQRILDFPLGNRKPGKWSMNRRYVIPKDAELGPTTVQETLVYDCGVFRAVVRSPEVLFTVKE